ncbi:MAG: NAD(P)H-dependent flavin oxidoreductase [Micromonosporaceae bacterium]
MRTALTDRLGLEHPVVSAGMARVSQGRLVAAVSNAGGMGCLGGLSYLPDALREEIRWIKSQTDRCFAVNLVVPQLLTSGTAESWAPVRTLWDGLDEDQRAKLKGVEPLFTPGAAQQQIEVVLDERPAAVALTFDVPEWLVRECHARQIQVMALVGTVRRAQQAERAGADFIIAQGAEGGGHTGYVGALALTPAVVDAVSVPVLAAGGIVDGRGVAAALCLGAAGVWVGTRFIASAEAYGHPAYKQRVLDATTRDTVVTRAYTGKPLRALRNEWTDSWADRAAEVRPFPGQYAVAGERVETAYQDGDTVSGMMPAGQGAALVRQIMPAKAIVEELVADAEDVLRKTRRAADSR